jgi:hypothetical protein
MVKNNASLKAYPIIQFRIFLREDDLGALEKIKDFLGMGRIYRKKYDNYRKMGTDCRDQYAYYITALGELLRLGEILNSSEFHTKKKKDFEIFFEIVKLKAEKKHLSEEGCQKVIDLAMKMNSQNREKWKKN